MGPLAVASLHSRPTSSNHVAHVDNHMRKSTDVGGSGRASEGYSGDSRPAASNYVACAENSAAGARMREGLGHAEAPRAWGRRRTALGRLVRPTRGSRAAPRGPGPRGGLWPGALPGAGTYVPTCWLLDAMAAAVHTRASIFMLGGEHRSGTLRVVPTCCPLTRWHWRSTRVTPFFMLRGEFCSWTLRGSSLFREAPVGPVCVGRVCWPRSSPKRDRFLYDQQDAGQSVTLDCRLENPCARIRPRG
jgi:hypothetical protein